MIQKLQNQDKQPRTWVGVLGVSIALSTPLMQMLLRPWLETFAYPLDRFFSLWIFWIAVAVVLGLAHFVEGIPLATFGFRCSHKTLRSRLIEWIIAVVAAFLLSIVLIGFSTYVRGLLTDEPPPNLATASILPFWVMAAAWVTASFTEELLFRSYAIERLTILTGRPWLAATISLSLFTLLHLLAWDWIHVLTIVFPAALGVTLLYLWRRNLVFVVIVHAIMNAPLLVLPLIAPYM